LLPPLHKAGLTAEDSPLTIFRTVLMNLTVIVTVPLLLFITCYYVIAESYELFFIYLFCIFLLIFIWYLNKNRKFELAKKLFLPITCLQVILAILIFGRTVESQALLPIVMIFVFFLFDKKTEWLLFGSMVFIFFFVSFYILEVNGPLTDLRPIPYSHFTNITFAILSCAVLSFFLIQSIKSYISKNEEATRVLAKNNEELAEVTSYINRQKEELELFTSIASHDLKTPIRTINSFIGLLEKNKSITDEKGQEYLKYLKAGAEQLNKIIEGISSFNKIEDYGESVSVINTKEVISTAYNNINPTGNKNNQIHVSELPHLKMNESHLYHIFQNLIENAYKYNNEAVKIIDIDFSLDSDFIHISVKDNGIGIAEEYKEYIFEPFKKLHASDMYESTGLGLAICAKIIHLYKGRISVSVNEAGSTFVLTFPKSIVHDE